MPSRTPYRGSLRRKLVLAFDVGTTYSGISYSVLDPGQVPEVKEVTRFPANELISGASKIPTVIYYDREGKVRAVGAEALQEGIFEIAEEENWIKAEWFKLHLRPKTDTSRNIANQIPPLPLNKTIVDVLADFLKYLFNCASTFIQDTHANGPDLWASVEKEIDFVLSHPNGWEGIQQSQMKKAAVLAGLIPDTRLGHSRISFVTEGEASLHFAIQNGLPEGALKKGDGVVIVDAGGGTIDISVYSRNLKTTKEAYEEIAAPQCHFHGSVFVSIHARLFLEERLAESIFNEDLDHIIQCFDKATKLRFRNMEESQYIKFGSTRDNDEAVGIRFGQLKLKGSEVATFFEPSVKCIVNAVTEQRKSAHKGISHVVLVGGFSASDWLFEKVHEALKPVGLTVIRPANHVNKAVSNGAISFYLDHFVKTRVSKVTYGYFCHIPYDPSDQDHVNRVGDCFTSIAGEKRLSHSFDIILPKNTQVTESKEFRRSYFKDSTSPTEGFKDFSCPINCYRGTNPTPKWKNVDPDNYTQICSIKADLSHIVTPQSKVDGKYYHIEFDIILLFGLTELKAQVAWTEKGVEKRTAAEIFYDPDITQD